MFIITQNLYECAFILYTCIKKYLYLCIFTYYSCYSPKQYNNDCIEQI